MKMLLSSAAVLVLCGGSALSQSCSTLTITGSINAGQTLTIAVAGAGANDPTVLAVSQSLGSTTLNFGPLGSLTLDLASPFLFFPLGTTDGNGDVSLSIAIPGNLPPGAAIPSHDFHCQAVSIGVSLPGAGGPPLPSLSFCASNTATLHAGP